VVEVNGSNQFGQGGLAWRYQFFICAQSILFQSFERLVERGTVCIGAVVLK
jgi:hypothetical protein